MLIKNDAYTSELREKMRGGKGTVELRSPLETGALPAHCRLVSEIVMPEGSSIGLHDHVNETEIYYMLEGELRAVDNGEEIVFRPGDALFTGGGAAHSVENAGPGVARLLAVIITE